MTVLGCEWAIGDHIESTEKGLQRRGFLTREPSLNGPRRDFEIKREARSAAQSIGRRSQRIGILALLIHAATQSRRCACGMK
jgi:hypothetical protein